MELAKLERLTYRYPAGERPALDRVSVTLGPGVTHVWGPSGGGKSTLLRVLNGLVPHFHGGTWAGRAVVAGLDVAATPCRRLAREVGFVFQDPERQAVATRVEREVAFALENAGLPRAQIASRVEAALDRLGVAGLAGRRLDQLSGGERQRVEIAAALALEPRLLVLDEPASQLDGAGRQAVLAACARLGTGGTAIVLADHGRPPADRGLGVVAGRIVEGPPPVPQPAPARQAQPGQSAVVEAIALVAGVGRRPVVTAGDLLVREGEVVALAGPNGGGKTTLLRTLAGLEAPLAGTVTASGRVCYLPQDPAALLHLPTVADEVAYTLRLARERVPVGGVLDEFELGDVATRYPRDLSGGQRERAALAAVLAGRPRLALLDEPTRGMDAHARDLLVRAVDRLAMAGGAAVIATHDLELLATADRVLEVDAGVVRDRRAVPA